MGNKTFWRCKVCGDIHYGAAAPELCPTCKQKNAYEPITKELAKAAMGFK